MNYVYGRTFIATALFLKYISQSCHNFNQQTSPSYSDPTVHVGGSKEGGNMRNCKKNVTGEEKRKEKNGVNNYKLRGASRACLMISD